MSPQQLQPPQMTILGDHPAYEHGGHEDQIGLNPRLAVVFDILRHEKTQCPMTIAITGDWGTGKSSAMRWLKHQLEIWNGPETDRDGHPCVYPVWFDPWKYHSRQDVWRGIIAEVILAVFDVKKLTWETALKSLPAATENLLNWLGRTTARLVEGVKVGVPGVEASVPLATITEDFHKTNHPEEAYLNCFENDLREWVKRFLGKNDRLCLFIDDLDRCLPEVTLEVLEALKLYLNIPNLIFVVGLDRAVVDAKVRKHYSEHGVSDLKSKDYLDKIFQVEIPIAPSEKLMKDYLQKQIQNLNGV